MSIIQDRRRYRYKIVPIGSQADGFALEIDDVVTSSNPRALPLAAYVDALVAGASELDATYIARAVEKQPWPPALEERSNLQHDNERHGPSPVPLNSPAGVLEQVLGEADALIRRRLEEVGLDAPHLIVAATLDSEVILRSNVDMDMVKAFGEDLQQLADEVVGPPATGDTTH